MTPREIAIALQQIDKRAAREFRVQVMLHAPHLLDQLPDSDSFGAIHEPPPVLTDAQSAAIKSQLEGILAEKREALKSG